MKKGKKIKKSNSVKIALTILVIALGIYLIYYHSEKKEIKAIETEAPSKITTPEIPITTTIEKTKPTKFISDLKCVNGNIMMTFTNILDRPRKISDFTFLIAGRVNLNPDCELTELQSGESTFCQNLNAGIKFRKEVLVTIGYPAHYEKAVVDCRPTKITANIVRDIGYFFARLFDSLKIK